VKGVGGVEWGGRESLGSARTDYGDEEGGHDTDLEHEENERGRPVTFLRLALCCTVLRSRWCQGGANIALVSMGPKFRAEAAGLSFTP